MSERPPGEAEAILAGITVVPGTAVLVAQGPATRAIATLIREFIRDRAQAGDPERPVPQWTLEACKRFAGGRPADVRMSEGPDIGRQDGPPGAASLHELDAAQLADVLQVDERHVRRRAAAGEFGAHAWTQPNGRWRFTPDAIAIYRSNRQGSA